MGCVKIEEVMNVTTKGKREQKHAFPKIMMSWQSSTYRLDSEC